MVKRAASFRRIVTAWNETEGEIRSRASREEGVRRIIPLSAKNTQSRGPVRLKNWNTRTLLSTLLVSPLISFTHNHLIFSERRVDRADSRNVFHRLTRRKLFRSLASWAFEATRDSSGFSFFRRSGTVTNVSVRRNEWIFGAVYSYWSYRDKISFSNFIMLR